MNVSSPDCFASHLHCNELVDIDLLEDSNSTKAYASDIFAYLKEAEVSVTIGNSHVINNGIWCPF